MTLGTSRSIIYKVANNKESPVQSSKETIIASPGLNSKPPTNTLESDYLATVNALTLQFLNEHEQTRVTSLE
jgi:vacuole morphology and inheritance protein 14